MGMIYPEKSVKCGGKCCENVYIPLEPEDLLRLGNVYLEMRDHDPESFKINQQNYEDIIMFSKILEPQKKRIYFTEYSSELQGKQTRYKCLKFDKKKRICTIYEKRPSTCRIHPVDACFHRGCKKEKLSLKFIFALYLEQAVKFIKRNIGKK